MTNKSPFPLTNVRLKVSLTSPLDRDIKSFHEVSYPSVAKGATEKCNTNAIVAPVALADRPKTLLSFACDQTEFRGAPLAGPRLVDRDYPVGPEAGTDALGSGSESGRFKPSLNLRFSVKAVKATAEASGFPAADAVAAEAAKVVSRSHAADTAYYGLKVEPGTLAVFSLADRVGLWTGSYSVYRKESGAWHGSTDAGKTWAELGKGVEAGAVWAFEQAKVSVDVVRPERDAMPDDKELDYRFRIAKKPSASSGK